MAQVTYTGAAPVLTPSLAADGDVGLGLWEPGETKDVPDEAIETLCTAGSAFSASAAAAQAAEGPAGSAAAPAPSGAQRRG